MRLLKALALLLAGIVLIIAMLGAGFAWWVHRPVTLAEPVSIVVPPRTTPLALAKKIEAAGVPLNPWLMLVWFRLTGADARLKAGAYEITSGQTPRDITASLLRGAQAQESVTLVEGWTFAQVREALGKSETLKPSIAQMSDAQIMTELGRAGQHPEGRFFPDTYRFAKGSPDIAVLRLAMSAMDKKLDAAWGQRAADIPLKTKEEALVLASIVEKETGAARDRGKVGGVFNNRLRLGMRLQTDPTVIYGMGAKFDGNLRKADLTTDTPYNTYTRAGLPPTPISMPGEASLMAAVRPDATKAVYFVARGDGSSEFSETLAAHNRAVNKYQKRR
jgi:UPF0755 protein